jgi:hypothetical protein
MTPTPLANASPGGKRGVPGKETIAIPERATQRGGAQSRKKRCQKEKKGVKRKRCRSKKVSVNGIDIFLLEAQDPAWLASYEWNIRARFITS